MRPPAQIFVSIGHGLSSTQERLVRQIEGLLRQRGWQLVTIGRPLLSEGNPLETIRSTIEQSAGTIVIAFERLRVLQGIEYPDTDAARPVATRRYPTVWNQIEAAMTIQANHPLLILSELNLHSEGFIDPQITPIEYFKLETQEIPPHITQTILEWIKSLDSLSPFDAPQNKD